MSGGVLRQVASQEFFLGAEPGAGPRAARREKRLVRFVHPSGMTSHELILLRQKELDSMSIRPARSTADEFGLRPPKLHTPREKAGTLRDPTYLERRRRVLDLNQGRQIFDLSPYPHVESILSTRPSGVPIFGEADAEEANTNAPRYPQVRAAKVPFETVADNRRESHQALRRKDNEGTVKMAVNHYFPSEKQVDASESSELESLGDAMGTQRKVDKWYEEMTVGEDPYRSNVLFLEVKMRELLGEAWPKQAAEPDVVRASVCCDMLARLMEVQPTTKELGMKLLDELIFSIFQSRIGARKAEGEAGEDCAPERDCASPNPTSTDSNEPKPKGADGVQARGNLRQWGQPYFVAVKELQERVSELQHEVAELRAKAGTEDEDSVRNRRLQSLIARVSGNTIQSTMIIWKQWHQKQASIRKVRQSLNLRFRLRWRPLAFYRWIAATEHGKRNRQQDIASMMKWEKDYQRDLEKEKIEQARTQAFQQAFEQALKQSAAESSKRQRQESKFLTPNATPLTTPRVQTLESKDSIVNLESF